MTQQRRDNASTEFGIWLRQQEPLDSKHGFVTTNIDYLWRNYKTKQWMLIEEKRHRYVPKFYQIKLYKVIDLACKLAPGYNGFHTVIFENTSPDDGGIWLDGRYIPQDDFMKFLRFEQPSSWYESYYPPRGLIRIGLGG